MSAASAEEPEVLALFGRLPDPAAREELVTRYSSLAEHLARRFHGRAEPEDLEQVAMLALVKAVDRFDPDREVRFSTYASVSIVGELKRHLRDTGWALRVPRQLQETGLTVQRAVQDLTQSLGQSPTIAELASHTGLDEETILEGLDVWSAYRTDPLDAPSKDPNGGPSIDPGEADEALALLEEWAGVADELRRLPPRERRILYLRFVRDLSQSQIAAEVGISQMHVSRLLDRTLARLRAAAEAPSQDD
jgi:RNA polymerase sigma-B factor